MPPKFLDLIRRAPGPRTCLALVAVFFSMILPRAAAAAPTCARAVVAVSADLSAHLDREARRKLSLYQSGRIDNLEAALGKTWAGASDRLWATRSGEKLRARIDRACSQGEMVVPGQLALSSSQSIGRIYESFFGRPHALATKAQDQSLAACQAKLVRATARCQTSQVRAFMHCQKGSDSPGDLEACLENPARSCPMADLLERACGEIASARSESSMAAVAPACGANDLDGVAGCAERVGKCLACERMNQSMGLSANCDLADDGISNATCAANVDCSQNPLKGTNGADLMPILADGGVLQLDCPIPPNTSPVNNAYDLNRPMSYFAWNTFIALNWPSAATQTGGAKSPRGIPNMMGNFQTAQNSDLVVWETYKEKREVFYQGTCEYPGTNDMSSVVACSVPTSCPSPVPENLPPNQINNDCQMYTPPYEFVCGGDLATGVMGECLRLNTDPQDAAPEGFTGRPCDPAQDQPDGTNSDCGSDRCVTAFGCRPESSDYPVNDCANLTTGTCNQKRALEPDSSSSLHAWEPVNRNPAANTWSGEQYSPLPSVDPCPVGQLKAGASPLSDLQMAVARNRPMLNTSKFTFNSLDETVEVASEALEDFEALCAGTNVFRCNDGPRAGGVCQIYPDGSNSCGPNFSCEETTESVTASMCEDTNSDGTIHKVCVNRTSQSCDQDSDCGGADNANGACQFIQLGQFPDRPACCSIRGDAVEPRVYKGNPADFDAHSQPGDPGTPLYYEVKVNYDYFDYVAGNNFYQSAFAGPAGAVQNFRLPFRTSGSPSGRPTKPQNDQLAIYNSGICLDNAAKERVCELSENRKVCSNDPSISCVGNYDCGTGEDGSTCNRTIPYIPCNTDTDCSSIAEAACPAEPSEETPCRVGSFQLKAAWVVLEDYTNGVTKTAADYPTYFTSVGSFFQDPGSGLCQSPALFGLVGLHIIQRTHQSYPQQPKNPIGGAFIFASWGRTESVTRRCIDGPKVGQVCGTSAAGTDSCGEGYSCETDYYYSNLGVNRSEYFPGTGEADSAINVGRMNTRPKVCSQNTNFSCLWDSDCGPGNTCAPISPAQQVVAGGVLPSAGTRHVNDAVHAQIGCSGSTAGMVQLPPRRCPV